MAAPLSDGPSCGFVAVGENEESYEISYCSLTLGRVPGVPARQWMGRAQVSRLCGVGWERTPPRSKNCNEVLCKIRCDESEQVSRRPVYPTTPLVITLENQR